jgi:hypothetical protein
VRLDRRSVEKVKQYLAANREALLLAGVVKFVVIFSGSGDEGRIEDISAYDNADATEDDLNLKVSDYEIPYDLQMLLEELDPSDYQDGLGGGVSVHCFVDDSKIRMESYYIVEVHDENPPEEY